LDRDATQPTLTTERLVLRPLVAADATAVQHLAGDRLVAETTLFIPHPYPDGVAEAFIAATAAQWQRGDGATWAVTRDGALIGCIAVRFRRTWTRAEIGYWIAVPEWGRGYATEAARAVVRWALGHDGIEGVCAEYLRGNDRSRRVMEKLGMRE
jgi:[ribosomal protein S5]-alanine N-acetyltransferase